MTVNRTGELEETLDRDLARSLRTDQPVNLLILDSDHCKKINDTHGHPAGDAVLLTDRIRRALETLDAPVTVSIGIATYPQHADDASALIEAADQALYESKRSGRDRATVSADARRRAVKVEGADV